MTDLSRRTLFKAAVAGAVVSPLPFAQASDPKPICLPKSPVWGKGFEGQRKADLGDGNFLNPIMPGDHPDPTILKDGQDYYMTFSSFNTYPGIVIWHSRDLVNWQPIGPALYKNIGTVWALDICKHNGRYFIYIPAAKDADPWSTYVIWADDIRGPWSDPINLNVPGCIDPGHAVGEDGKRYLFVNGIRKIPLTDDGLATAGELTSAYQPWRYPEDWIVENFAPEGPKIFRRGEWFYLVTAVGGTAGPVTGHMVIAARSRSIHGPWEHCPHNPLVRTLSESEPWWSKGHATVIEGPEGDWWMVYHAYENGYRTLGRQTLLEPIEWRSDGWFYTKRWDLSVPHKKPTQNSHAVHGVALSDNFSRNRMGTQWAFHHPTENDLTRFNYLDTGLVLQASGSSPIDSSPLTCNPVDRAYVAEVSLQIEGEAEAGLILFYNHKAFVGVSFNGVEVRTYQYAEEHPWARVPLVARSLRMRIINQHHVITYEYSIDQGKTWRTHPTRMETSGIHHNVFGNFLSLRVGIYCSGSGQVTLRDFTYKALQV